MHNPSNLHRSTAMLWSALLLTLASPATAVPPRFDFSGDGRVNMADAQLFAAYMSGPGVPHDGSLGARAADIDGDGDVDQRDFGIWQRCYRGDDPADPACANLNPPFCTLYDVPQTLEDTPFMIQLLATDEDLPWDELTFAIPISPNRGARFYQVDPDGTPRTDLPPVKNGDVVTNSDAKLWFVPPANFWSKPQFADIAFRYSVRDAAGAQGILDVSVKVAPVNDPPEFGTQTYLLANVQPSSTFRLNPTDVEAEVGEQTFTICFTALPQHGTLYADGIAPVTQVPSCFPTLWYTYVWHDYVLPDCGPDRPAAVFPMSDSFTCYVSDGFAGSAPVTDAIEIVYFNSPPVLSGPTSVETVEETFVPLEITATDVDNDEIVVSIADPLPTRGTLYYYDPDAFLTLPVMPGQQFAGVPVALTYVPFPDANTADGVADVIHVRLHDVRLSNPLSSRNCDYPIPIHIAPVNDSPVVTCTNPLIIANVLQDGTIQPAFTNGLRVADDALPGDLLSLTLTAAGPEADHLALIDPTGLVGFQQVSPTQIQFQGTLAAINAAFAQGVNWYPNASQTNTGTLTVEVNDQGHVGTETPPVPLSTTFVLDVQVDYEGSIPLEP